MITFLDVEASALDNGFPVEVAWCSDDLLHGRTYLVAPGNWADVLCWDPEAQAVHGLSIDRLRRDGLEPWDVARRLEADLDQARAVLSDNVEFDSGWLATLYLQDDYREPPFVLEDADVVTAGMIRGMARIEALEAARQRVYHATGMKFHRALDDAIWNAVPYCLARGVAEDEVLRRVRDLLTKAGR